MKKTSVILFLIIVFTTTNVLTSYRDEVYSDTYPNFDIHKVGDEVFFAGYWQGNYVVIKYADNEKMETFIMPTKYTYKEFVHTFISDSIFYFANNTSTYNTFSLKTENWKEINVRAYIDEGNKKKIFTPYSSLMENLLPPPSYNAYNKWLGSPPIYRQILSRKGPSFKIGNDRWYTILPTNDEEYFGLGGIGYYDSVKQTYGVIRDSLFSKCNGFRPIAFNNYILFSSNNSKKYDYPNYSNLVILDTLNKRISKIPFVNNFIEKEFHSKIKLIDSTIWISTNYRILRWDLKEDSWKSYLYNKIRAKQKTYLYNVLKVPHSRDTTHILSYLNEDNRTIIDSINKDEILTSYYILRNYSQAIPKSNNIGWLSIKDYDKILESQNNNYRHLGKSSTLFLDSTLTKPISSFNNCDVIKLKEINGAIKVSVPSSWIKIGDFYPAATIFNLDKTPKLKWRSLIDSTETLKGKALKTFEQEQKEIELKTPVWEKVIDISIPLKNTKYNAASIMIKIDRQLKLQMNGKQFFHYGKKIKEREEISIKRYNAIYTYKIISSLILDVGYGEVLSLSITKKMILVPSGVNNY